MRAAASPGRRFGLRGSMALVHALLIAAVMAAVGLALYRVQRQALLKEARQRALSLAQDLAALSREPLLLKDSLGLALLAAKAAPPAVGEHAGHDLSSPRDWAAGMARALRRLLRISPGEPAMRESGVAAVDIFDAGGRPAASSRGSAGLERPGGPQAGGEVLEAPVLQALAGGRLVRVGEVRLELREDPVDRAAFEACMQVALLGLLGLGLGALAAYLLAGRLAAPLTCLARGALAIAGGDFSARVPEEGADELGRLSRAFNAMARRLAQNELLKAAFTRFVSGEALDRLLADPSMEGLKARRVQATLYVADLRGFTALSERLDPEPLLKSLNTVLGLQAGILLARGGQVDRFIGDAALGVWRGGEGPAAQALSAARAAWEVQEAMAALNRERRARGEDALRIGIGLHRGELVAGNMGCRRKMEYTVTGEALLRAEELCAACPGGEIWMSSDFREALGPSALAEEVGAAGGAGIWRLQGWR